jgi:hypothetical protein
MRRYYYSFYYAEGPMRGDLITTINFIVCGFLMPSLWLSVIVTV